MGLGKNLNNKEVEPKVNMRFKSCKAVIDEEVEEAHKTGLTPVYMDINEENMKIGNETKAPHFPTKQTNISEEKTSNKKWISSYEYNPQDSS
jgi:hypothetical protein